MNAVAIMLNMKNYFTDLRVVSHQITFRVEENPENKTAEDVSRAISDIRVRNNLARRLGFTVLGSGIGKNSNNTSTEHLESTGSIS